MRKEEDKRGGKIENQNQDAIAVSAAIFGGLCVLTCTISTVATLVANVEGGDHGLMHACNDPVTGVGKIVGQVGLPVGSAFGAYYAFS